MLDILRRLFSELARLLRGVARPEGLFAERREAKAYKDVHEAYAVRNAREAIRPY